MTTTSRGRGDGAGASPTAASTHKTERVMPAKIQRGVLRCSGYRLLATDASGNEERAGDEHSTGKKRHPGRNAPIGKPRTDRPDHPRDTAPRLLDPHHQSVLVSARAVAPAARGR